MGIEGGAWSCSICKTADSVKMQMVWYFLLLKYPPIISIDGGAVTPSGLLSLGNTFAEWRQITTPLLVNYQVINYSDISTRNFLCVSIKSSLFKINTEKLIDYAANLLTVKNCNKSLTGDNGRSPFNSSIQKLEPQRNEPVLKGRGPV